MPTTNTPFQSRVQPWMLACFGEVIAADREERNHRFLEEALELVQACGCSQSEAHQLVDYVFGRPVGEKTQEVGGVMVTLAALCLAQDLDMHENAETELARIWTKVEAIRAKQAAKPKHSPLPVAQPAPSGCSCPSGDGSLRWPCMAHPPAPSAAEPQTAWVWNPAKTAWEEVRAPGNWQQGALYAFGPLPEPLAPPAASEREALTDERKDFDAWLGRANHTPSGDEPGYQTWPAIRYPDQEDAAWIGWQARAALHSTGKPDREAMLRLARDAAARRGACIAEIRDVLVASGHDSDGDLTELPKRVAAAIAATADAPVAEPSGADWYIVICQPGMVPNVKGAFTGKARTKWVEDSLRELAELHPDAYLLVMSADDYPILHSGVEWVDMFGDVARRGRLVTPRPPAPEDAKDAARYRWLRAQHWEDCGLFVVNSLGRKHSVPLGTSCPSEGLLDDEIDAAMAKGTQG